jgi:predicted nucleic acid-binding protein
LHVPEFCDLEVAAFVRGLMLRGAPSEDAGAVLAAYAYLPLERHSHTPLLRRVLSLWANFTTYDAVYVALAEALEAPLLTLDARLARATRTHTSVQVMGAW